MPPIRDKIPLEQLLMQGFQMVAQAKNQARRNELQAQQLQQQQQQFTENMKLREENLQLQQKRVELEQQRFTQAQTQFTAEKPIRAQTARLTKLRADLMQRELEVSRAQEGIEGALTGEDLTKSLKRLNEATESSVETGTVLLESTADELLQTDTETQSNPLLSNFRTVKQIDDDIADRRALVERGELGQLQISIEALDKQRAELAELQQSRAGLIDKARKQIEPELARMKERREMVFQRIERRLGQRTRAATQQRRTASGVKQTALVSLEGLEPSSDVLNVRAKFQEFVGQGASQAERERRSSAMIDALRNKGFSDQRIREIITAGRK